MAPDSVESSITNLNDLLDEQEWVQAGKFQGRLLTEYNKYIFPGQNWQPPRSDAVTDLIRPLCQDGEVSLLSLLRGMYAAQPDKPVNWVDMGGGRGLSMRELAADTEMQHKLITTNVDLFEWGLEGLTFNELNHLESLHTGITDPTLAPDFIKANIESVILPQPADVITCIETLQYLNDPLAAIGNCYNQLADNGLMLISTEHNWAGWIRYQKISQIYQDKTPTEDMLKALTVAGVTYAASYEMDDLNGSRPSLDPSRIRNLVIQKMPGTLLLVYSQVIENWTNPDHYKAAYYRKPKSDSRPLFEVLSR